MGDKTFFRNAKEIGAYVGINERIVPVYVKDYNLPAWRFKDGGNWRALRSSLDKWLSEMEQKHLCQ